MCHNPKTWLPDASRSKKAPTPGEPTHQPQKAFDHRERPTKQSMEGVPKCERYERCLDLDMNAKLLPGLLDGEL